MFPGQCWLWAPASCSVCRGRTKCRLTQRGGGCSAGASDRAGRAASAQLCSWTRCQLWHSCCRSLQRDVLCGLSLFPFVVAGVPVRASVKSRGQGRHCCTLNQLRSLMGDEYFLSQRAGLFRSGYLGFSPVGSEFSHLQSYSVLTRVRFQRFRAKCVRCWERSARSFLLPHCLPVNWVSNPAY